MVGRGDSKNREDFLQEVGNISKELELINKELEKYKNNDPDTLKLIENTAQVSNARYFSRYEHCVFPLLPTGQC